MISLTIKFRDKQLMEEWIEDMSDSQVFSATVTYREEENLDKFNERYVLTHTNHPLFTLNEAEEEA